MSILIADGCTGRSPAGGDATEIASPRPQKRSTGKDYPQQAQRVLEAAKEAYETTESDYDDGTAVFSEVCVWSRRWLAAELRIADGQSTRSQALMHHLDRMRRARDAIKALYEAGERGGEKQKLDSANYFVAEAELLLLASDDVAREALRDN